MSAPDVPDSPEAMPALGAVSLFGVIVQAGTDSESGRPRLTIETTEQQLRDLSINPYGKQCRVEVLEIIPAQMTPNIRISDSDNT